MTALPSTKAPKPPFIWIFAEHSAKYQTLRPYLPKSLKPLPPGFLMHLGKKSLKYVAHDIKRHIFTSQQAETHALQ